MWTIHTCAFIVVLEILIILLLCLTRLEVLLGCCDFSLVAINTNLLKQQYRYGRVAIDQNKSLCGVYYIVSYNV